MYEGPTQMHLGTGMSTYKVMTDQLLELEHRQLGAKGSG